MIATQQSNKYFETTVHTASPEQLLLMLYDGAIRHCRAGIEAIRDERKSDAHQSLLRVQDIVHELMVTVNPDVPIAKQLLPLYEYFNRRLIEANTQKKPEPAEEVLRYLVELKETWATAALKVREMKRSGVSAGAGSGAQYG